jgi:hypothetical protein
MILLQNQIKHKFEFMFNLIQEYTNIIQYENVSLIIIL